MTSEREKEKVMNGVGPHEKRAKSDANLGARFLRRLQCLAGFQLATSKSYTRECLHYGFYKYYLIGPLMICALVMWQILGHLFICANIRKI